MAKRRPSGDGMVRKREDGRWEGRIVVGHKDNGDSIFRYVYADTQKELTARLRKCITAYQGVDLTEQSRLTLSEWLDQWLVSKEGMVRRGTLNGYRGYIENHIRPCLGEKRIRQIKAVDIQRFYDMLSRKLASGTVRRIHTTLHGILKAAAQAWLVPRNPVEEVTPPKFSSTVSWRSFRRTPYGMTSSTQSSPPACGGVSCAVCGGRTSMRQVEA